MAGMINGAMAEEEPGEGPAHEGAESRPVEVREDAAEAAGQPEEGADIDSDPGYQEAMAIVMDTFYRGGGAKDVAKAVKAAPDPVDAIANIAYDAVTAVDERTQGVVPDELVGAFACQVLGEVADIAEAAGVKLGAKQIAEAVKIMLMRYATDNGLDSQELQQAMGTVDTDQLGQQLEQQGAEA